ncbi:MAG TPA: oligosaccharide flippase family protein [Roseiarcus sp.]|nr:oligosaccharide flippase family protein [Roseiarcus sp.]
MGRSPSAAAEGTIHAAPAIGGGRRLAVNALAGGGANALKIGVQLVMLPLMAHLLGPGEFGLYALALPMVSFCMILADGGLAASLAREPLESVLVWSSAFWLVLAVGFALAVVAIGWGVALAALSREPRVSSLMCILSISLLMISAAALPSARLTREARLTVFAAADVVSTLLGASVAVILAISGFGAKSLAAQYVTYHTLRAIILNATAFVRPQWRFQLSDLSNHLSVGSALLGVKMSDFFGRMIENVLYGRAFGAAGLGAYAFANQAPRFICEAASGPVWAALYAFALREKPDRLLAMHVRLVRLLSSLVFPIAALLSASAPQILDLILGPRWSDAGELLRLLIPFYALGVVSGQTGAVLLAKGRGWLLFWLSLFLAVGRIAAVAAGPLVGQAGVALGVGVALAFFSLAMFSTAGHPGGARRLLGAPVSPILAAALAGTAAFALLRAAEPSVWLLALAWGGGGLVYIATLALMQGRTLASDIKTARSALAGFRQAGTKKRTT